MVRVRKVLVPGLADSPSSSRQILSITDNTIHYDTVFCSTCKTSIGQFSSRWRMLSALEGTAEEGCQFCSLLLQGIYGLLPGIKGSDARLDFIAHRGWLEMRIFRQGAGYMPLTQRPRLEFFTTGNSPFPFSEICGISEHPENYHPATSGDTSSDESLANALDWIKTCTLYHKSCDRTIIPHLPTRVLDIESWPIIKLYENQNEKAHYLTLSHSWGGHHPIVTTQSTLQYHKEGINFNSLPKTYQDAILITRRIGFRYVWIDSLCIIQDSKSDWEQEAGRMAEVYQNSWLTISATRSSSPTSGCFNSPENQAMELRGQVYGSPFILYARHQIDHVPLNWGPDTVLMDKRGLFPLLTRGWAYQERLLSARVLHFGPQEVFWECREDIACECKGIKEAYVELRVREQVSPKIAHNKAVSATASRDKLHSRWRHMVVEYCERKLTVGSDRLPAFAGIAKEMQNYRNQRYLAGLWEDSFITDLLWKRNSASGIEGRVRKQGAPQWAGTPTWSWAVVDCEIEYDSSTDPETANQAFMKSCCEISEVQWTPTGKDSGGDLPEAYMIIVAWIVPGLLYAIDPPTYSASDEKILSVAVDGYKAVTFRSDFRLYSEGESYIEEGEKVYCAKIAENSNAGRVYYWLVLKCLDAKEQVYERIGLINNTAAKWISKESKRKIKVV